MDGSDAMNRVQFVAENGQPTQSGLPKALRFTFGSEGGFASLVNLKNWARWGGWVGRS